MLIKAQKDQDFQLIEALAREIWTEHYTPIIGRAQVNYMLGKFNTAKAISSQVKNENYIYYLILENNEIVGYTAIQFREKELFLSKFYVKSSHQGKGYGREVMNFIVKIAGEKELAKIALAVNKNNLNTISKYEKMGFRKIESVVTDIGEGYFMDDYIMEKQLY